MTAESAAAPGRRPADPSTADGPPTIDKLRTALAQVVGIAPADVGPDANLIHLGLGSLEMMRLVTAWHRDGVPADFSALAADPTIAGWQRHLAAVWPPQDTEPGKGLA